MRRISGSMRQLIAAVCVTMAACQRDHEKAKPARIPADTAAAARASADSAGGEVVGDSAAAASPAVVGRWITDANALALLGAMNARQAAAADVELRGWHSDSVRAYAVAVARLHAELQHSVDSVTERVHLTPIAPALAESIDSALQSRIDSLSGIKGMALDRAFVHAQVASLAMVADYARRLSSVAERPEVQALMTSAAARVGTVLGQARVLEASFAKADSVAIAAAADSSKRSRRRKP
jgi:hypothetical protein